MIRKVKQIMELAIEVSETTESDVFVWFHGHVHKLNVYYYPEGYRQDIDGVDLIYDYLDSESIEHKLDRVIDKLEDLKDEA